MEKLCNKCKWFENNKCIHIEGPCLKLESDGRRPDSVEFSSMEEDAKRRDLTINGMFFDPIEEKLYDFVGGLKDIEDKIIRFIGNANDRIEEDKLRMLRAVRFASRLGFHMNSEAFIAINRNIKKIEVVSKERVREELEKMMMSKKPSVAINLLKETGLLDELIPEVGILWGIRQSEKWHAEGHVAIHSLNVLDLVRDRTDNVNIMFAALLHDIGKAPCFSIDDGVIRAHGHDSVGAGMAEDILINLKFSNKDRDEIVTYVAGHMKIKNACEMRKSKLRKLISNPFIEGLLLLGECDSMSSVCLDPQSASSKFDWLKKLRDFIEEVEEQAGTVELPKPFISGNDLIEWGLEPGPLFREILDGILEKQLNGEILDRESAIEFLETLI